MSIELLELAAAARGELLDEVVFVGGATVGLWITDPAAPAPRPTKDVDVIIEVTSRGRFHEFEERLRGRGFREDAESGVICRWRHGELVLDVMPTDASISASRTTGRPWRCRTRFAAACRRARGSRPCHRRSFWRQSSRRSPAADGTTTWGAATSRMPSACSTGVPSWSKRSRRVPPNYAHTSRASFTGHQAHPRFLDGVYGGLLPDDASQARAEPIVLPRVAAIVTAA